jgi:aminoglycoside phosphotransferase (APT) family kinase protein
MSNDERWEDLRVRVEEHLRACVGDDVTVSSVLPLAGGACQENFRVELEREGAREIYVLRSDAPFGLPGSIDRRAEAAVIREAVAAHVRTPPAEHLVTGLVRPSASAYFLPFREGEAIGKKVVSEPELASARQVLPTELAAELARIHSVTPASAPGLGSLLGPPPIDLAHEALRFTRTMLDLLPEPSLALELAFRWLDDHHPAPVEPCLVHGDFRVGNFLVGRAGLTAVLDWEFAHWGSPFEDLAWISVRAWRFGRDDLPVGGLSRRKPFFAAYEAASGRAVDAEAVHWWEVLGNLRWGGGCVLQGERYLSGASRELELLAIPSRAIEMEYEALRLIERGPEKEVRRAS